MKKVRSVLNATRGLTINIKKPRNHIWVRASLNGTIGLTTRMEQVKRALEARLQGRSSNGGNVKTFTVHKSSEQTKKEIRKHSF